MLILVQNMEVSVICGPQCSLFCSALTVVWMKEFGDLGLAPIREPLTSHCFTVGLVSLFSLYTYNRSTAVIIFYCKSEQGPGQGDFSNPTLTWNMIQMKILLDMYFLWIVIRIPKTQFGFLYFMKMNWHCHFIWSDIHNSWPFFKNCKSFVCFF